MCNGTFQYSSIDDVKPFIIYSDGGVLQMPSGYEDVAIEGLTVEKQQKGLIDRAYGGAIRSGITTE